MLKQNLHFIAECNHGSQYHRNDRPLPGLLPLSLDLDSRLLWIKFNVAQNITEKKRHHKMHLLVVSHFSTGQYFLGDRLLTACWRWLPCCWSLPRRWMWAVLWRSLQSSQKEMSWGYTFGKCLLSVRQAVCWALGQIQRQMRHGPFSHRLTVHTGELKHKADVPFSAFLPGPVRAVLVARSIERSGRFCSRIRDRPEIGRALRKLQIGEVSVLTNDFLISKLCLSLLFLPND